MNWNYDDFIEPEYDYDDRDEDSSGFIGDDGHWYNDPGEWRDAGNFNPPGTIDCGDGYVDDDGIFVEY